MNSSRDSHAGMHRLSPARATMTKHQYSTGAVASQYSQNSYFFSLFSNKNDTAWVLGTLYIRTVYRGSSSGVVLVLFFVLPKQTV